MMKDLLKIGEKITKGDQKNINGGRGKLIYCYLDKQCPEGSRCAIRLGYCIFESFSL